MADSSVTSCPAEQAAAQQQREAAAVGALIDSASTALDKFQKEAMATLKDYSQLVPAVANRAERSLNNVQPHEPPKQLDVEWLMSINIATKDFGQGDNIERRLEQLKNLSGQTKGKPVAIAVQVAHCDLQEETSSSASVYKFFVPTPYHVDRYIIHDGNMTKTDSSNSRGYAGDVKELLSFSAKHFKPNKSVLLIDSHGTGNVGLSGDIGRTTLRDFTNALDQGWPKPRKIDVIDFDSCLMAQEGVLKALQPLASHVVASPETERALGQDLRKVVGTLIERPEMTPGEYADALVEIARLQPLPQPRRELRVRNFYDLLEVLKPEKPSDIPDRIQVRTLAHFSLANYEQFRSKLDDFGDALSVAIRDPKNRQAIDRIIENGPSYGDWFEDDGDCKDLKSFVDSMFHEIASGKISDDDGRLRITGGRVLDAHKKLVVSYSGFDQFGARGGLSDYLPDRDFLDFHRKSRNWIVTGDYSRACSNLDLLASKPNDYIKAVEKHLGNVKAEMKRLESGATQSEWDEAKRAFKAARDSVESFRTARDTKETLKAVADLTKTATELAETRLFQDRLAAEERKHKANVDKMFRDHLVDTKSGWGRFRHELRRLD